MVKCNHFILETGKQPYSDLSPYDKCSLIRPIREKLGLLPRARELVLQKQLRYILCRNVGAGYYRNSIGHCISHWKHSVPLHFNSTLHIEILKCYLDSTELAVDSVQLSGQCSSYSVVLCLNPVYVLDGDNDYLPIVLARKQYETCLINSLQN